METPPLAKLREPALRVSVDRHIDLEADTHGREQAPRADGGAPGSSRTQATFPPMAHWQLRSCREWACADVGAM
eukprot:2191019-Prorocentrum_lima.AAC.1